MHRQQRNNLVGKPEWMRPPRMQELTEGICSVDLWNVYFLMFKYLFYSYKGHSESNLHLF
jgi:hypothetical protein